MDQPSRRLVIAASVGCVFIISFALSSYSVFLPALLKEFPFWTRAEAILPFTICMAVWGLTQPLAGMIADSRGTRMIIVGGIVVLALGFVIMGVSQALWQVAVGFGLVIGTALSACGALTFSLLIAKWFTGRARASAAGVVQAAVPACPILLAPLFFFAIASVGWRASSLGFAALLLLVALPLAHVGIHDPKVEPSDVAATRRATMRGELMEVVKPGALRNLFLVRIACGLGFGVIIPHLGTAAVALGLTPADGAFALSVYGAAGALSSFLGGFAADRWGRPAALIGTLVIRGLGTFLLALPALDRPLFFLAVALACGPITATFSINNVQVFELGGVKRAGLLLGLSLVLHQLAGALAPYFTGMVFDWTGSYRWPFIALGFVMLLSTLPAARTRPSQANLQPAALAGDAR